MADSIFNSLLGMLDRRSLDDIAGALGESEQSVSQGLKSSIAAILGSLASRSGDQGWLQRILDFVPSTLGDVTGSQIANSISDPNSSLISIGRRILSAVFGTSENQVTSAISGDSGLRPGATATLLAAVGPMVLSFLGRKVREERLTMEGLGSLLQRESGTIRSFLPASLISLFWPQAAAATSAPAAVSHEEGTKASRWVPLVALALLVPALFWIFNHMRKPATVPTPTGSASRLAPEAGDAAKHKLPNGIDVKFAPGSSKLDLQSKEQINDFASTLKPSPDAHVKVSGYTDNVGSDERNLRLSQKRANAVMAELTRKGIPSGRVTSEGFGEQNPVGDNATQDGRAMNRHAAVNVTY